MSRIRKQGNGWWIEYEENLQKKVVFFASSNGFSFTRKYDEAGKETVYYEDSNGNWYDKTITPNVTCPF